MGYRFGNTRTSQLDGYTASALKINSGYSTPIGPLYLYHNTFFTDVPNTDGVALLNPGNSTLITARNNIIAGTRYVLYKVNPVVLDWNWDDFYTTDTTRFVYWQGTPYSSLSSFRSGTGQELQGLSVAPNFVNPTTGDFGLVAGSALIDAGVLIAGINDDYVGNAPDIGAYEYIPEGDTTPPTVPTGLTATAVYSTQINLSWKASTDKMYGDWQLGHMPIAEYVKKHAVFAEAMRAKDPGNELIAVGDAGAWDEAMLAGNAANMSLISEHFYVQEAPGLMGHVAQVPRKIRRIAEAHRRYRERIAALKRLSCRINPNIRASSTVPLLRGRGERLAVRQRIAPRVIVQRCRALRGGDGAIDEARLCGDLGGGEEAATTTSWRRWSAA